MTNEELFFTKGVVENYYRRQSLSFQRVKVRIYLNKKVS